VAPLKQTVADYCPKCSVDTLPVTVNDVASGAVPSKLVAYLQTHPQVNYVDFSFADLLTGAQQALKAAGLTSKVKIVGQALGAGPQVIKAIEDGSVAAWVAQPNTYQAWLMVDAMARLSEGLPLSQERQAAKEPTWVVDSATSAKPLGAIGGWDGPPGFQNEFKQLWQVG
jgi:ribose transport system substrate-binding protein